MLFGTNWSPLLFGMLARGSDAFFVLCSAFFLSFVVVGHVLLLSLLGALIFEIYNLEMDVAVSESKADPLQMLFPTRDDTHDGAGGHGAKHARGSHAEFAGSSTHDDAFPIVEGDEAEVVREGAHGGARDGARPPALLVLSSAVRQVFARFDLDQSGSISASELQALLVSLGDAKATDESYLRQVCCSRHPHSAAVPSPRPIHGQARSRLCPPLSPQVLRAPTISHKLTRSPVISHDLP